MTLSLSSTLLPLANTKEKQRCAWSQNDALMQQYHDEEWGVPVRDSRELW